MSGILEQYNNPSLDYIGSVDLSSANSGSNMFSFFFDSSMSDLGNTLMFEYKLIEENDPVVPSNVTLGFISIENATHTGIVNQWSIAIPAQNNVFNPSTPVKVAMRVYIGILNSTEIGVSKWSNELSVYNPPEQPVIASAFYDNNNYGSSKDDLYLFLNKNDDINYNQLKFVVAYYYRNASNNTVWEVSDPIAASSVVLGNVNRMMVHVPEFGFVSDTVNNNSVYAAVYAVYEFNVTTGSTTNRYYSVSHVSNTENALPAADYASPTNISVSYSIYDSANPSQNMIVSWEAPLAAGVPTFTVGKYIVEKSINNSSWSYVSDVSYNVLSQVVNVSSYNCAETVYFRVTAVSTNGTLSSPSATTANSQRNIFKYATAPQGLTIANTSFNSGVVNLTVNFSSPTTQGCGDSIKYQIVANGIINTNVMPSLVTNELNNTYSQTISFSGAQSGIIDVYLVTKDTNLSGNSYPERNGAIASIPYFASTLVLAPVDYDVYDTPSTQNMNLSWNAQSASGWTLNTYKAYKIINESTPVLFSDNISLSAIYNASGNSCADTIAFYVEAVLKQTYLGSEVTYTAKSNTVSIKKFTYATAPQGLTIANTSFNSGVVNLTVNFSSPTTQGCGDSIKYQIVAPGIPYDVLIDVSDIDLPKSISFTGAQSGIIDVYLVTKDTNSNTLRNGAIASIPYFASTLVLDPVDYDVYNTPSTQNMILTWNQQDVTNTGWYVSYRAYKKIVNNDSSLAMFSSGITGLSATYDANSNACGETLEFYVEAVFTQTNVTYIAQSNKVLINMFKYATAPQNLSVTNASFNFGVVNLTVNFSSPTTQGCGDSIKYHIVANGNLTTLSTQVLESDNTYSQTINFNQVGAQSGIIDVYLVTEDTNLSGDSYPDRNGAIASIPYFASNLKLNEVNYDVYNTPSTQNMILTWNAQSAPNWTTEYRVYKNNSANLIYSGGNTQYAYDASSNVCGETLQFYVMAVLTYNNGGTPVYTFQSNTVSKNVFKYASAPTDVNVLWAVASTNLNTMDIRMTFKNPSTNGCGTVQKIVAKVLNYLGNQIGSAQDITYDDSSSNMYTVNFNDINLSGTGTVQVYMITTDTNSAEERMGAFGTAPYTADQLPIFRNILMGSNREVLSFNIISHTVLKPTARVLTKSGDVFDIPIPQWNTTDNTSTLTGVTVSHQTLNPNGEIEYTVTMYPSLLNSAQFPSQMAVFVANDAGVGAMKV